MKHEIPINLILLASADDGETPPAWLTRWTTEHGGTLLVADGAARDTAVIADVLARDPDLLVMHVSGAPPAPLRLARCAQRLGALRARRPGIALLALLDEHDPSAEQWLRAAGAHAYLTCEDAAGAIASLAETVASLRRRRGREPDHRPRASRAPPARASPHAPRQPREPWPPWPIRTAPFSDFADFASRTQPEEDEI
jgi:hypothetical protein